MRHAAKRDTTEPAIIAALQRAGWSVIRLSDTGAPDLLAIRHGVVRPVECKSPGGALTPAQRKAFLSWAAAGLPVTVAYTPDEAIAAVCATTNLTPASSSLVGATRRTVKHPAK